MQMLLNFTTYMKADFQPCEEPNSIGESCGCFRGENTMGADERGVRPNADLSMICAFLVKYAKPSNLPDGVTWDEIEKMAMESLVFAYSTHKANRLKPCAGGRYWGSTSNADHTWESSLWAMSVAYSAFFQWEKLSSSQRDYVYRLLKAECNYELERDIPTGYAGDTKAEENGWEADVLAVTLGLFPDDPLAPRWFHRLREFAVNSYSQRDDANDHTVIDPDYDQTTVAQLYRGQNLYDDFTLQNHNYFHTSYQNVVVQELGEAALALKLFQKGLYGKEKWKTNALMHNNSRVMNDVLYWLAVADGELAMPNGNDWSLFLYDQITSYSTAACFLRDPHALMLEDCAYKMIRERQKTTADGSWLLRADVGARRMGVEAHRVMMTWLMHEMLPTHDFTPTPWEDFRREYSRAKVFPSQNIVRASTASRFTCFSWSEGLKSYTGYIAPHNIWSMHNAQCAMHNTQCTMHNAQCTMHNAQCSNLKPQISNLKSQTSNLIVPFRANNTGNLLGWYEVQGHKTNAKPVVSGNYQIDGEAYIMNGELNTNDSTLNHRFAIWSTPGNAVIYADYVRANADVTITAEKGGLLAISVDEFTSLNRTLYTDSGKVTSDGRGLTKLSGSWLNVDNTFGICPMHKSQTMAFGECANNNSVMTARLYALYSDQSRTLRHGEETGCRAVVYYSDVDTTQTALLSALNSQISFPEGWSAVLAFDPDSTAYLLVSNFAGQPTCHLERITTPLGIPVLSVAPGETYTLEPNHSRGEVIKFFIDAADPEMFVAVQEPGNPNAITIYPTDNSQTSNLKSQTSNLRSTSGRLLPKGRKKSQTSNLKSVTVRAVTPSGIIQKDFTVTRPLRITIETGKLTSDH